MRLSQTYRYALFITGSLVLEATAQCSRRTTVTLTATADVAPLATCTIIDANLRVEAVPAVDLDDVEILDGAIYVDQDSNVDTQGTSISSENLRNITGYLTAVATSGNETSVAPLRVDFPELDFLGGLSVRGVFSGLELVFSDDLVINREVSIQQLLVDDISLIAGTVNGQIVLYRNSRPSGSSATYPFRSTVYQTKGEFRINSNVGLESVSLTNLDLATDLRIYSNEGLKLVDATARHAYSMLIEDNGGETVTNLSRLETLGIFANMEPLVGASITHVRNFGGTFRDLKDINLSALKTVNQSLTFEENEFSRLSMPALDSVQGALTISENPFLSDLNIPRIVEVQFVTIDDNDRLTNLTLNTLKRVRADLIIDGKFTNVELFSLEYVGGDLTIKGEDSMDCSWFDENMVSVVQGQYECDGNHTKPDVPRSPSTPTDPPPLDPNNPDDQSTVTSGGLNNAAKAGIGAACGVVGIALIGALAFFIMKRRRRRANAVPEQPVIPAFGAPSDRTEDSETKPNAAFATAYQPKELDGTGMGRAVELPSGGSPFAYTQPAEMDGARPIGELATNTSRERTGHVSELPVSQTDGRMEMP